MELKQGQYVTDSNFDTNYIYTAVLGINFWDFNVNDLLDTNIKFTMLRHKLKNDKLMILIIDNFFRYTSDWR